MASPEFSRLAAGRNELIEPVRNIGNRAIFIGACRSLSVDADKFASVQANCIYYSKGYYNGKQLSYIVYSLEEGVKEDDGCTFFSFSSKACVGVVQLLCRYASYVESSQLRLVLLHGSSIAVTGLLLETCMGMDEATGLPTTASI